MGDRRTWIILAAASEDGNVIHCRAWDGKPDLGLMEELASRLTQVSGEPSEWIHDFTESPDGLSMLFTPGGGA